MMKFLREWSDKWSLQRYMVARNGGRSAKKLSAISCQLSADNWKLTAERWALKADCCLLLFRARRTVSRFLYPFGAAVIRLGPALLPDSSDLPESRTERAAPPLLFGLAPRGVYPAGPDYSVRGALLPHLFTLTHRRNRRRAVYFLWHFP